MSIAALLAGKRICICVGSGGVGKTTTSAAIALGMAARGARVAVVTIDPARRLAGALGLEELGNEPRLISPERLAGAGIAVEGELWAMMLDSKRTFDELIDALAPDAGRAQEIKDNRIYRSLSTAVAGSQEFTAVSKLYELAQRSDFDLLVLDTPPSRSATEFFEAPGRLTSFLEGRTLRAFMRPTGFGLRVLHRGAAPVLAGLRRVTGGELIAELSAFFGLLGSMTQDFSARAAAVESLLRSEQTAFMLVASAQRESIEEAAWLRHTLRSLGLPLTGVVVNRFHHELGSLEAVIESGRVLSKLLGPALTERVLQTWRDYGELAARDAAGVQRLERELGPEPPLLVPHFDDDVHDLAGLARMEAFMFASDEQRAQMLAGIVA